jgi:hypothetical protein
MSTTLTGADERRAAGSGERSCSAVARSHTEAAPFTTTHTAARAAVTEQKQKLRSLARRNPIAFITHGWPSGGVMSNVQLSVTRDTRPRECRVSGRSESAWCSWMPRRRQLGGTERPQPGTSSTYGSRHTGRRAAVAIVPCAVLGAVGPRTTVGQATPRTVRCAVGARARNLNRFECHACEMWLVGLTLDDVACLSC